MSGCGWVALFLVLLFIFYICVWVDVANGYSTFRSGNSYLGIELWQDTTDEKTGETQNVPKHMTQLGFWGGLIAVGFIWLGAAFYTGNKCKK